MVSVFIVRSASAWALPRPSAIASAKLANRTVNHSQREQAHEEGALTAPPRAATNAMVVMTLPISTTNMTGLRDTSRGSSLTNERARPAR